MISLKTTSGTHYYFEDIFTTTLVRNPDYGKPGEDKCIEKRLYAQANRNPDNSAPRQLPYDPIYILTDEHWLKERLFRFHREHPDSCEIHNYDNLIDPDKEEYTHVMSASIPKGELKIIDKECE